MDEFAEIASYNFNWVYSPKSRAVPDPPYGSYRLEYAIPLLSASGVMYIGLLGGPDDDVTDRKSVNYSATITWDTQQFRAYGGGRFSANTRLHRIQVKWTDLDAFKATFEKWIQGPLTVALRSGMSQGKFVAAVRKLDKALDWKANTPNLATPEEVEALKQRFNYADSSGLSDYTNTDLFDDPRVKGHSTDYNYMTSDDVRFWNMMADEYDARKQHG